MKERRTFPRYPINFPVSIAIESKSGLQYFDTKSVDISRSSIQISCDSQLIEVLLSQDEYPHLVQLHFKMPGDKSVYSIQSQVVTHRRLAQNHYYLVIVFNHFVEGSDDDLAEDLKEYEPGGFRVSAN